MNRRQFLGASLAGIIAALSLPFERFAEWCREWLPKRPESAFLKAKAAEIDALYEQFGEQMSRALWGEGSRERLILSGQEAIRF